MPDGSKRPLTPEERSDPSLIPEDARPLQIDNLVSSGITPSCIFPFEHEGVTYNPGGQRSWKTNKEGMTRLAIAGRLMGTGRSLRYVRLLDDFPAYELNNVWEDVAVGTDKVYVVQTPTTVVQRCVLMTSDPGDLVLDPTCGSGTTPFAAEQWGRRWITIDTSRVALALARTRLMSARYPFYLLADSPEGATKQTELTGRVETASSYADDVRKGFVCNRVTHVQLRSIAQNTDIHEGMSRAQVENAIAKHAESELLVDQPYEDPKRVRVSGRFTVESLSPHRILDPATERPMSDPANGETPGSDYTTVVIDNLRTAGVQNTRKGERLQFDRLEPWPGEWLNAAGEYSDAEGTSRRVAVSIGPEHGTVGPVQVKEAAKEALRGVGFAVLVICGFAFDAAVGETAREFGNLVVLLTKMNPDLTMGAGLLKKTGSGNLFMVFGEPDVIVKTEEGVVCVELRGLDIYDPTTGEVRSSSTEDIACWFIDIDYDQESFFVRHAYFTGGDDPYEQLRRALQTEIDEATWQSLYSTVSQPFPAPSTGKIAVKIINHFGDEVMRVYDVA